MVSFTDTYTKEKKSRKNKNKNMECYTTGPPNASTPNNNSAFYDNNNYAPEHLNTPEQHHHNQYYGYHQNYLEFNPVSASASQTSQHQQNAEIVDNNAELWAAQQSCFSLSSDSIHSSMSQPGLSFEFSFITTLRYRINVQHDY